MYLFAFDLCICEFKAYVGMPKEARRTLHLMESALQVVVQHGCWELSSSPLEEQEMLLTRDMSLVPIFKICYYFLCNVFVLSVLWQKH